MKKLLHTIVSDLDGTLVPGSTFEMSDRTVAALQTARDMGIRVILASGRSGPSMLSYVKRVKAGAPYIASNGAQTYDRDGKLIRELTMNVETAHRALRFLKDRGVYVQTYFDDFFYYDTPDSPIAERYKKSSGLRGEYVPDLFALIDQPTVKLLGVAEPERIPGLIAEARAEFADVCSITTSEAYFLEVVPSGATKGLALAALANDIGFTPEGTLAMGDSLNDQSMLEWAGMSAATGNARDEIKRCASLVCGRCEEDGAAGLIERLLSEGYRP